jgi:hypothetical protein
MNRTKALYSRFFAPFDFPPAAVLRPFRDSQKPGVSFRLSPAPDPLFHDQPVRLIQARQKNGKILQPNREPGCGLWGLPPCSRPIPNILTAGLQKTSGRFIVPNGPARPPTQNVPKPPPRDQRKELFQFFPSPFHPLPLSGRNSHFPGIHSCREWSADILVGFPGVVNHQRPTSSNSAHEPSPLERGQLVREFAR